MSAWCADFCRQLALPDLARRVRVAWNPRMRTTAGRAWWPNRWIELNPKLREISDEEVWRTLKHELAHLVAYERAGRRRINPHGREWREACRDLGIPDEKPFHTLPFQRRRMERNLVYACSHCGAEVRRVRPMKRAAACLDCCRKLNGGRFDARFMLRRQKKHGQS